MDARAGLAGACRKVCWERKDGHASRTRVSGTCHVAGRRHTPPGGATRRTNLIYRLATINGSFVLLIALTSWNVGWMLIDSKRRRTRTSGFGQSPGIFEFLDSSSNDVRCCSRSDCCGCCCCSANFNWFTKPAVHERATRGVPCHACYKHHANTAY